MYMTSRAVIAMLRCFAYSAWSGLPCTRDHFESCEALIRTSVEGDTIEYESTEVLCMYVGIVTRAMLLCFVGRCFM
jgi:hypothetical protein